MPDFLAFIFSSFSKNRNKEIVRLIFVQIARYVLWRHCCYFNGTLEKYHPTFRK
jgi:hypothetical protein